MKHNVIVIDLYGGRTLIFLPTPIRLLELAFELVYKILQKKSHFLFIQFTLFSHQF